MRKLKLLMAIVLVVAIRVPHLDAQASKTTNKPEAGSVQADPQKIRAHVKFLSSDLLEGRGTGQRGGDIAAEYIATEFALYGLKPAGDQGTYFHEVPMVGVKTLDETSFNLASSNSMSPWPIRGYSWKVTFTSIPTVASAAARIPARKGSKK